MRFALCKNAFLLPFRCSSLPVLAIKPGVSFPCLLICIPLIFIFPTCITNSGLFRDFIVLILPLLVLPLLLLVQGQHYWRSRNPSATAATRCTIGPATAHRRATARGAACYATTSPSLSPRCKEFPVAKLLPSHSTASADVRLLTSFLYAMQQPLWAQSRG